MKILIIDDSKDFRLLVRQYLAKTIDDAEPVEYAVEELGKPAEDFPWSEYDILLLDYNLGGEEEGFDWLKQFKQKAGFPPTIILTAEGDEYIAVKAIKLGAADYINKIDITPKRLADVIKDATEFASKSKTKQQEEINSATHLIENMHKKESDVLPDEGLALGYKLFAR